MKVKHNIQTKKMKQYSFYKNLLMIIKCVLSYKIQIVNVKKKLILFKNRLIGLIFKHHSIKKLIINPIIVINKRLI